MTASDPRRVVEAAPQLSWQQPADDVAPIEWRDGDHVEDGQQHVDLQSGAQDGRGRNRHVRLTQRHGRDGQQPQRDGGKCRQRKVAGRPRSCDEDIVAPRVPQPSNVDRHRLRPSEQRHVCNERQQREQNRSDQIDVYQRIERDAAERSRGRVAQAVGATRVRSLVNGQRKQEDGK